MTGETRRAVKQLLPRPLSRTHIQQMMQKFGNGLPLVRIRHSHCHQTSAFSSWRLAVRHSWYSISHRLTIHAESRVKQHMRTFLDEVGS
jgi:hypothetical protein